MCEAYTQECQTGSSLLSETDSGDVGLFLDLQHPSQCEGVVKAWEFCYYGRATQSPTMAVDLLLYRMLFGPPTAGGAVPFAYVLVSSKAVVRNATDLMPSGFHCETVTLAETEWFHVRVGDVIGACLPSSGPIRVLGSIPQDQDQPSQMHVPVQSQGTCLHSHISALLGTGLRLFTESMLVLHVSITTSSEGKLNA